MNKIFVFICLFVGISFANDIIIKDAFVKQNTPNSKNTAIFLKIINNTKNDISLIGAKSDFAKVVELHDHIKDKNKITMIKVDEFVIKAQNSFDLLPGGAHIMLFDIKENINKNTKINLKLIFSDGNIINIKNIPSKQIKHMKK